jgi:hypothetical protein
MSNVLTVNALINRAHELDGQPVDVVGLLTFEFENCSLNHFPTAARREITDADDAFYERSSVWIAFGTGSIQPNQDVLTRWTGKRVRVVGIVRTPKGPCGCGHFGGWACEIEAFSIERI